MMQTILAIVDREVGLENKLDMLTAIGTTSTNDEVFRICEEIRNELLEPSDNFDDYL